MNDMNDTVVVDDNPPSGIDHGKSDRRDCLPALNRFGNASRRVLPMINTLLSIAAFVVFKWAFLKLFPQAYPRDASDHRLRVSERSVAHAGVEKMTFGAQSRRTVRPSFRERAEVSQPSSSGQGESLRSSFALPYPDVP
jgi:hypothetical protein